MSSFLKIYPFYSDFSIIQQIHSGITGSRQIPIIRSGTGIDETDVADHLVAKGMSVAEKDDIGLFIFGFL